MNDFQRRLPWRVEPDERELVVRVARLEADDDHVLRDDDGRGERRLVSTRATADLVVVSGEDAPARSARETTAIGSTHATVVSRARAGTGSPGVRRSRPQVERRAPDDFPVSSERARAWLPSWT